MPKPAPTIAAWMEGLSEPQRADIEALRRIVGDAGCDLTEEIKWNAPSYAHVGRDRVTLGIEPRGGYRIVLHRGAKAQDAATFRFEDADGLAAWPSPDRGVVRLADGADIQTRGAALSDLIARWISATA